MKKQGKNFLNKKRKHSQKSSTWSRMVCAALCVLMILFSFVSCNSYATSDEISLLKTNLETALEELDALKTDHSFSQEEITTLKEANRTFEEELNSLKNINSDSAQKIAQLQGIVNDAEKAIDDLKVNNAAAQKEINSLKETNEELQQEMESLKGDKDAALQEIEKLKEKIQALQNGSNSGETVEKIKIYIDQGHNPTSYHNSGATGNGLYEENLTFTIGKLLAQLLEEDGRFEVQLSRPTANTVLGTDGDSSLDARVNGAKDFGADYFISLHTNSFETDTANGIEVYVAEENSVSYNFGRALLDGLLDATGLYNRGMKLNPDLRVLKNTTMPAALLEMGFISNVQDANMLSQHPDLFAKGIYNGILAYFDLEPNAPLPV